MGSMIGFWCRYRNRHRQKDREIFRFWDGSRDRGADPLCTLRSLVASPSFDVAADPALAAAGDTEAAERTLAAIRSAFGVVAWRQTPCGEELGLTESEMLKLLDDFGLYLDDLKKNSNLMPISPPAMDSTGYPTPPPVAYPPAKPTSDPSACTSTCSEAKPDGLPCSCAESATA